MINFYYGVKPTKFINIVYNFAYNIIVFCGGRGRAMLKIIEYNPNNCVKFRVFRIIEMNSYIPHSVQFINL